jgi:hypothetical protein
MCCIQAKWLWVWLYQDWDTQPLNMPITHVMVNSVVKGTSLMWVPHRDLLPEKLKDSSRSLTEFTFSHLRSSRY